MTKNLNIETKFSIINCNINYEQGTKIEIKIEDIEAASMSHKDIYKITMSVLYLFILSKKNKDYKFTAYELNATFEHIPNIMIMLDLETFNFFIENIADMFFMLEIMTLQAIYLQNESNSLNIKQDTLPEIQFEKFKTLNQKLIGKIKQYKKFIPGIDIETMETIKNIFKIFDGDLIAYVDFDAIAQMLKEYDSTNFEIINKNDLYELITNVLTEEKIHGAWSVYVNNICVYQLNVK
jgi:hypothetical protein